MLNYKIFFHSIIVLILIFNSIHAQVTMQSLGLENKNITSIGFYESVLAVGTNGNGVYWRNSMSDTTWTFIGLDSAEVHTVYPHKSGPLGWAIGVGLNPDNNYPHFVYCSFMGDTFQAKDNGIDDSMATIIHQLDGFPDPTVCGETYAAAGGALYRRNFNDTVWTSIYTATVEGYVQTVKTHDDYPGVVLTGGAEGFAGRLLLKSLDFGNSWEWIAPPDFVSDIEFAGDSAQTIFLVAGNVYRSLDAGQSWNEIFNTSNIWINKVIYDSYSSILWIAGTDDISNGNFVLRYSWDLGDNWFRVPIVLQNPVLDMVLAYDGWLYIATPDSGVFGLDTDFVMFNRRRDESIPQKYILNQNYPNPFNPRTNIQFSIPKTEYVTLKIYNLLGKEVSTLVSEEKKPGNYNYTWNGSNYASGVYYYKLQVGTHQQVNKMILLK
jgi:hypothetical protein